MSITGALQIGRSALLSSQVGMQVTGNNMANAGTVGYSRQVVRMVPAQGQAHAGHIIGRGVEIETVSRIVDTAMQQRLRDAISGESGAMIDQRILTAIETVQNELSSNDLSSLLSAFFNSFSELANKPGDSAIRSFVIQQGVNLVDRTRNMHAEYGGVRDEVNRDLGASVDRVNTILDELARINGQIPATEAGGGQANALRDQRDRLVDELAEFMDVTAIEQANGTVDVLVGSIPVVLGGTSRGVEARQESAGDQVTTSIHVRADGTPLDITSGRLGALLRQREQTINPTIEALDEFASHLIFQINRLHSQGQGEAAFTSVEGTYETDDATANLNSAEAALPYRIENGSFFIHVKHAATGATSSFEIRVDGDAMSLDDLVDQINTVVGVPNVTASVSSRGSLRLDAAAGYAISFADDTSGALAALGINTFFVGESAATIAVNQRLLDDANLLAAGMGHIDGSNDTALQIAGLQDQPLEDLDGSTLREFWQISVNSLAVRANAAGDAVAATRLVREGVNAQMQAVSGVSLDEEAINLLSFQRSFQAAARFISVIDETIQTLLSLA